MPRGNDPDARREFLERHGGLNVDIPTTNAEELIRAHRASVSTAVTAASRYPVDVEATERLDLGSLRDKAGGEVVSATVRGNAIVCAVSPENGRIYKIVLPANDRYQPPPEPAAEAELSARSVADMQLQTEVAEMRAEHEKRLAEMRSELTAEFAAQFEQLRTDGARRTVDAVTEAKERSWSESVPEADVVPEEPEADLATEPEAEVEVPEPEVEPEVEPEPEPVAVAPKRRTRKPKDE